MPTSTRRAIKYVFVNGLADSKGYIKTNTNDAEALATIISSFKANCTELDQPSRGSEEKCLWIARAITGYMLSRLGKLRVLCEAFKEMYVPPEGETGENFQVDSKKLKKFLGSSKVVALTAYGSANPEINEDLVRSLGLQPERVLERAEQIRANKKWL